MIRSISFWKSASVYGCRDGKSLMSSTAVPNVATCAVLPSSRNRSATPRWSSTSIVREWNPPAREPGQPVIGAPLEQHDVDLRQRQLRRQHHPRRPAAGDHHSLFSHPHSPRLSLAAGDYAEEISAS